MKRAQKVQPDPNLRQTQESIQWVTLAFKSSGYLVINKAIAIYYGLMETILLSYLIDKWQYWNTQNKEDFDGWFYCTHTNIQNEIGLSDHQIREIKRTLKDLGLIMVKKQGTPAKDYYFINFDEIQINLGRELVLGKTEHLPSEKPSTINKPKEGEELNKRKIKNKKPEEILIQNLDISQEFKELFLDWLEYKRERRESYKTEKSVKLAYEKLKRFSKDDPEVAKKIIEHSMSNNYAGFFEPDKINNGINNTSTGGSRAPVAKSNRYGKYL